MSTKRQESFEAIASVFLLEETVWNEKGFGFVRFVFDLKTYALRLIIGPGTPDKFECKLGPRVRSKGPRAYVVRSQKLNSTKEDIWAIRFEQENDSKSFRNFVEHAADIDATHKDPATSSISIIF